MSEAWATEPHDRRFQTDRGAAGALVEPHRPVLGEPGGRRHRAAPLHLVSDAGCDQPFPGRAGGRGAGGAGGPGGGGADLAARPRRGHHGRRRHPAAVPVWAWPLTFVPSLFRLPPINDVTTDIANPPRFLALAKQRPRDANPATYPGERFAKEQQKAYPDVRTFTVDRSVEESFELVEEVVRKLKWKVVQADPPVGRQNSQGRDARGHRPDAGGGLHRRRRRARGRRAEPVAHRRALGLALRRRRPRPERDAGAPLPHRALHAAGVDVARRRRTAAARLGSAQAAERTRSAESGESERTSPRSIRYSTWARTERDAALRSLGLRSR